MQQIKTETGKNIPMINSFLNLCRVCPVPADDKVNSEYKRNFTWHDGYQAAKVDVIKNAPSLPHSTVEPSLPRKKKHPEFAYRTHELLFDYEEGESSDSQEIITGSHAGDQESRARSEDRKRGASSRSRSADSTISRRLKAAATHEDGHPSVKSQSEKEPVVQKSDEKQPLMSTDGTRANPTSPTTEGVPKTTEYRSQFVAWTRLQQDETGVSTTARKSASMGLIAPQTATKDAVDGDVNGTETWNVGPEEGDDDDAVLDAVKRGRIKKTEYKSKFRPFSAYTYVDGNWKKATRLIKDGTEDDVTIYTSFSFPSFVDADFSDNEIPPDMDAHAWYSEVVERLKKADQYKVRSHGIPFYGSSDQPIPPELLSHIRDRSALSPMSVASTTRTWKDDKPSKDRARSAAVPVHHTRKEKKESIDGVEHPKGSPKKKATVEKTTVRPKSAEPVIPVGKGENKSPKRTRPRAPKDLPVHGHGDLSVRKKAARQAIGSPHGKTTEKASPMGTKPRPVPRPHGGSATIVNGDDGKVWLKPATKDESEGKDRKVGDEKDAMVNGYPESVEKHEGLLVNGEAEEPDSVQQQEDSEVNGHEDSSVPPLISKPPVRVPLTTVKSPEEVTGVRSPDPETWTVPLEIGKGLQWMDGKTPDFGQTKSPPILLSKRLKESSLVSQGQKDYVLCDPGSASGGETADL